MRTSLLMRAQVRLEILLYGSPSFKFRTGEPIVISFPKSGRTWLRYLLAELGVAAAFTHGTAEGWRIDVDRVLKSRIVHLRRDPRDTVVSYWFQRTKREKRFNGGFKDFIRAPQTGIGAICAFNEEWLRRAGAAQVLPVTYEALHRDTAGELTCIAAHLTGFEPDPAAVAAAVSASEFSRMREAELNGRGEERFGDAMTPADRDDPSSFKTRRGIVGGWRDYFDEDDTEYAASVMRGYSDTPAIGE